MTPKEVIGTPMPSISEVPAGFPIDLPLERELDNMGVFYYRVVELPLSSIVTDHEAQVRTSEHQAPKKRADRYATQMKAGATFPAIVVAENGAVVAGQRQVKMVDGNTRRRAALNPDVGWDKFPAYVLKDVSFEQCRQIGVYMNQRNGRDLDDSEARKWVNEALEAGMSLTNIARISGFAYSTVKRMDGIREFGIRAKQTDLPTEVLNTVHEGSAALLADKVQHNNVFAEAAKLAADAHLTPVDLRPLVTKIAKTGSDTEAFELIAKERAAHTPQIKSYAEAVAEGVAVPEQKVRPPYYTQMRKHLSWLSNRGALELYDPSTSGEDSEQLIREVYQLLGQALGIYAERKSRDTAAA
jgi:hypothetical protein